MTIKFDQCFDERRAVVDAVNAAMFAIDLTGHDAENATFHTKHRRLELAFNEKIVSRLACWLRLPCAPLVFDGQLKTHENVHTVKLSSLQIPPYNEAISEVLWMKPSEQIFDFMKANAETLTAMFAFMSYCGAEDEAIRAANVISDPELSGFYFVDFEQYLRASCDDAYRLISFVTIFEPDFCEVNDPNDSDLQNWAHKFFNEEAFNLMQEQIKSLSNQDILDIVQSTSKAFQERFEEHADLFISLELRVSDFLISRKNTIEEVLNTCLPQWLAPSRPTSEKRFIKDDRFET